MKPEIFTEHVLVWLGALPITDTMVTSLVTSLLLVLTMGLLARAVVRHPSGQLAAADSPPKRRSRRPYSSTAAARRRTEKSGHMQGSKCSSA